MRLEGATADSDSVSDSDDGSTEGFCLIKPLNPCSSSLLVEVISSICDGLSSCCFCAGCNTLIGIFSSGGSSS